MTDKTLKIKEDKINRLKKMGFKEQHYPVGSFILNNDVVVEPNRNIRILTEQGVIILQYLRAFGMVEE